MKSRQPLRAAAVRVVDRLRSAGHDALWAGGCVRDMLLGREPSDIDVATGATPPQIISLFAKTRKVGAQFGVVLVKEMGHWIEVATFRRDLNYVDGRRPEQVVFTDAREDALRRDFTINGLFYDPVSGEVIDHVGGRRDLEDGLIRAIGEPAARFEEDHLRMLRAPRFAARFEFGIEDRTAAAIQEHAPALARISPERIREELEKMLTHPSRARAVMCLSELGLLDHLWPGADWPADRAQRAGGVLAALPASCGFVLALAALLHDRPPGEVAAVAQALRCSNREQEMVRWLVEQEPVLVRTSQTPLPRLRRLRAHAGFEDLLTLHQAVCTAYDRPLAGHEAAMRLAREIPRSAATPPPLVTGNDLLQLGLQPGPVFKRILDQLYDAQLNNELADREHALQRLSDLVDLLDGGS